MECSRGPTGRFQSSKKAKRIEHLQRITKQRCQNNQNEPVDDSSSGDSEQISHKRPLWSRVAALLIFSMWLSSWTVWLARGIYSFVTLSRKCAKALLVCFMLNVHTRSVDIPQWLPPAPSMGECLTSTQNLQWVSAVIYAKTCTGVTSLRAVLVFGEYTKFSITIQIQWEFQCTLTQLVMKWFFLNFAYNMTAMLLYIYKKYW